MKKRTNHNGFTMAELLIVVAIIVVLAAVSFIAVANHQRSMTQLEYDTIAKEIFIAAQNHLTMAESQGYPGLPKTADGQLDTANLGKTDKTYHSPDKKVYYYVVDAGSTDCSEVWDTMLPFGSIDEMIRLGGTYIISYQPSSATVLDVFYSSQNQTSALTARGIALTAGDYDGLMDCREDKTALRSFAGTSGTGVVGWFGDVEAVPIGKKLETPLVTVHNEDMLWVEVNYKTDPNSNDKLILIIQGKTSGAKTSLKILPSADLRVSGEGPKYQAVLDDITTSNMQFATLPSADLSKPFIPGEDIEIEAVAYNNQAYTNIAYSGKHRTNSLFESLDSTGTTAYIGCFRHLENLGEDVSKLGLNASAGVPGISSAIQKKNLIWDDVDNNTIDFVSEIKRINGKIYPSKPDAKPSVYKFGSVSPNTDPGYYLPISHAGVKSYDGKYNGLNHSITGVAVKDADDAGLFATLPKESTVKNLELIDFSISGIDNAGALIGTLSDSTITGVSVSNVLVRNGLANDSNFGSSVPNISVSSDTGSAGGLIGNSGTASISFCAAAVYVKGNTAGGLIGKAGGDLTDCYSGGHTQNGSYNEWVKNNAHLYDVTGGTVGGLVGTSSAMISNSYSTCSVSGVTAGGFAGNASGIIKNCYATGLVSGSTAAFAFVASGNPDLSGNYYYRVINEVLSTKENAKEGETEPMPPVNGYVLNAINMQKIKPLDLNTDTYNRFVGLYQKDNVIQWDKSTAYDTQLNKYYSGRYPLRTVFQLPVSDSKTVSSTGTYFVVTHYGDWPSPEVFFIN